MKTTNIIKLLKNWVIIAAGVGIASHMVDGINYDSGWTLLWVVLLLSLFNILLKPILVLFTLPFIILTFGLGLWLINALLFVLVAKILDGFQVANFWSALWGALIVSIVSLVVNALMDKRRGPPSKGPHDRHTIKKDDAIDI